MARRAELIPRAVSPPGRPRWRTAAAALGQLLFPRTCASCEALLTDSDRGLVCGLCWARLPLLRSPQCARCGHPERARGACVGCALLPHYVRAARSVCWVPHEVSSRVLSALKYEGWPAVAGEMAERMARLTWPPDVVLERTALVPVPLARVKERARGYNQAERLASAVSARWGIPVWHDALVRTRATPSQTRLTPGERLAFVHGAFVVGALRARDVRGGGSGNGTHLVLVDDVLTTGATLNACAAALFGAGARTLSYLTFGRARAGIDAA